MISNGKKILFKKCIIVITVIFVLSSCFITQSSHKAKADLEESLKKIDEFNNRMRLKCINTVKTQIIETFKPLLKRDKIFHLIDLPIHKNFGDTLIWLGEEKLIEEFNLTVKNRIATHKNLAINKTQLQKLIQPEDTILLHGGGNFGDLWRGYNDYRNFLMTIFPDNQMIVFPHTVNYKNMSLVPYDYEFFKAKKNLTVMTRCYESYNFTQTWFPEMKSMYVPDMAFVLGDIKPMHEPAYDILVIRRNDKEGSVNQNEWAYLFAREFEDKYTYLIRDWIDYDDAVFKKNDYLKFINDRKVIVNKIISEARLVIADRLHASIISVLMGKPHIMINDKFKKVFNTRESAFRGKHECNHTHLRGFYATDIIDALKIAKRLLNNNLRGI